MIGCWVACTRLKVVLQELSRLFGRLVRLLDFPQACVVRFKVYLVRCRHDESWCVLMAAGLLDDHGAFTRKLLDIIVIELRAFLPVSPGGPLFSRTRIDNSCTVALRTGVKKQDNHVPIDLGAG